GGRRGPRPRRHDQPQCHFGHDRERPLRPDEELGESEARRVLPRRRAGSEDAAFGAHCLEREDILRGDPVLEATWAAGVRRDVAADRRALERGGVGRIEEPCANRRLLEIDRPRAGSDRDAEVVAIDGMDPVEPLEAERDPVAARHRLSPAHVLRFDANLPPFAARLAVSPRRALAARGEYPEGSYRELREAAAAYAGCAPDELAVDAGADGLIGLVARTFLGPGSRAVTEHRTYPLYAIASRLEGAEVDAAPRQL